MAKGSGGKKRRRRGRYSDRLLIAGIVAAVLIIILYLFIYPHDTGRKATKPAPKTESIKPLPEKEADRNRKGEKKRARVAIIIDDLGQDMKPALNLLSLDKGITLAVLPGLPHSRQIAETALRHGHEVLLHLPMERKNGGERRETFGTLRNDMTPMQFLETLRRNIDSVPGIVGINNHEGSALTENREAMKFLMAEIKAHNLFFIDSLTSPKSTAYAVAREFGVRSGRRDVFLDNDSSNPAYIRSRLKELERIAKKRGWAIGIGHPHPETIRILKEWLSRTDSLGIEVVPVSELVK